MSIGRRLFHLAKSELNSLLDKAADWRGDEDDDDRRRSDTPLSSLSDEELEREIERRRRAKATAEAEAAAREAPRTSGTRPAAGAGSARAGAAPPPPRSPPNEIARAYAALELPVGSDFEAVKASYRRLMRKYHPDRHAGSPEKQRSATELAQRLSEAYAILEKHLKR